MRPFIQILLDREVPETLVHPVDQEAPDGEETNLLHPLPFGADRIEDEWTFLDTLFNYLGWAAILFLALTLGAEILRHIPH